jgi:hypothetical protein
MDASSISKSEKQHSSGVLQRNDIDDGVGYAENLFPYCQWGVIDLVEFSIKSTSSMVILLSASTRI